MSCVYKSSWIRSVSTAKCQLLRPQWSQAGMKEVSMAIILLFNCLFLLLKPHTYYLSPHCFSDNESPSKHILSRNRGIDWNLSSKSFRNIASLTDVKNERTDGQLFGLRAGRKADKALLWLESQIFVKAWDAGMCVHGLKTLSPKQAKVFLIICFCFTPSVLLLCLISHLRISQSWNSPFFLHSMKTEVKKRKQTAPHRY